MSSSSFLILKERNTWISSLNSPEIFFGFLFFIFFSFFFFSGFPVKGLYVKGIKNIRNLIWNKCSEGTTIALNIPGRDRK